MTRSTKSWLTVLIAVLLLCIGFAMFKPSARGPRELSATFRGWGVNPVWPSKPAVFLEVTNPTSVAVFCNVFSVERQNQAGWNLDEPALVSASVEPGEAFTLRVPVAISNAGWRITLLCQERAPGFGGMTDRAKEKIERIAKRVIHLRYDGRAYYVTNEIRGQ